MNAVAAAPASSAPRELRTLTLAALGGALEFYDFIIFVFFAPVIGQLFFPPTMPDWLRQLQTFGIFAAGYLARPLGGIVMAHFGDLLRPQAHVHAERAADVRADAADGPVADLRADRHAGAGAAAAVSRDAGRGGRRRGAGRVGVRLRARAARATSAIACGTLTAGLTAGILLGSLIATAVNTHFDAAEVADYAWRIPFLLGGVFGLFSVLPAPLAARNAGVRRTAAAQASWRAELPLQAPCCATTAAR